MLFPLKISDRILQYAFDFKACTLKRVYYMDYSERASAWWRSKWYYEYNYNVYV